MPKLSLNASKNTKHTPAGEIPVDWGCVKFGEAISSTQLGGNYAGDLSDSGTPLMKMGNMLRGRFSVARFERIPDSQVKECDVLRSEDLLLNTRNSLDLVGKVSMWRCEFKRAVFNSNMMRLSPNTKIIYSHAFLNYVLNSEYCLKEIAKRAIGTTSVAAIYWRDLATMWLPLPPGPEQRKIADILSTWDEAIETLDALIATKTRQKQALMQQLLSRSSSHASTGHARHRLREVCERVTRKNGTTSDNVLTISAQGGLVNQRDYFNRSVAGADLSRYYLLKRGEFAYNRSSAKGYPFGAIKRLDQYDCGVVSTLYLCFRIKANAPIDPNYLCQYFEAGRLNSGLRSVAKEGARAHGLLNVTADEFFDIDIFLPTLAEQQQIAAILDTADHELTLLRTQRQTLDQQKRGLMQRLLTGKTRVKP